MKRFILAVLMLLGPRYAFAVGEIWLSTTTATADTAKTLCPRAFSTVSGHGVLHGICIDQPVNFLAGTFTVFNASGSATNALPAVNTGGSTPNCLYFDIAFSSGLSYSSVSTATVTALFTCK